MKRKARKFVFLVLLATSAQAEENKPRMLDQFDAGMVAQVGEWDGLVKVVRDQDGGGEILEVAKLREKVVSPNWIAIDPDKTYLLKGFFRSASSERPASAYFGLIMYDRDKRPIYIANVAAYPNSDTELAQAAEVGQTSLIVSDADKWINPEHAAIAFDVKEDMSDLPNFSTSSKIEEVVRQDGQNELILKLQQPLQAAYPAGTRIRVHEPWAQPLFWVANEWVPPTWKKYEAKIRGEASSGTPIDQFWPGTRFVRVFFELGNWDKVPMNGARLQCQTVSFSEL